MPVVEAPLPRIRRHLLQRPDRRLAVVLVAQQPRRERRPQRVPLVRLRLVHLPEALRPDAPAAPRSRSYRSSVWNANIISS